MEDTTANRHLTCILFPGVVKNEEKALSLFGGVRHISHIHSQSNKKRLDLSFQPDNPYVKKIYADEKPTAGVVLKLRVKKTRVNNEVRREVISTNIIGRVTTIYKFESMCDFQYLPLHRVGDGPLQCILEKILLSGVDDMSVMSEPTPSFIVPTNFTRSDKAVPYFYTDKRYVLKSKKKVFDKEEQMHQRLRGDRKIPGTRIAFNLLDVLPTGPHEEVLKVEEASLKGLQKEYDTIKKLFEEQPIWSHNLIRYHTKINAVAVKALLPCFGVCLINGPWRMMWVRFGYDPRKEPGARFYQTLDFRVRHQVGVYTMVNTAKARFCKGSNRVSCTKEQARRNKDENSAKEMTEGSVIFRPGMVPTKRQIFYQYRDIKIPEVEAILAQEPPPGYLCHQKRGWLPPNTDEVCRDHIFKYVKQTLLSTHSTDLKLENASSDGSSSDDEDGTSSTDEPSTSNT